VSHRAQVDTTGTDPWALSQRAFLGGTGLDHCKDFGFYSKGDMKPLVALPHKELGARAHPRGPGVWAWSGIIHPVGIFPRRR
jgi:hypothetical protein